MLLTFTNGVHPQEFKSWTNNSPVERLPFFADYVIPLSQHIGAPSKSLVRKGQYVARGEKIAEPGAYVSVAYHSPVDGVVSAVELAEHPGGKMVPSIKIKADPFSSQRLEKKPIDWKSLTKKEFADHLQNSGMVGLGGAAFPSHVKFAVPDDKKCDYLIINGCECEPFLTADHRVMAEYPLEVMRGIEMLQYFLTPKKTFIGIEANKKDAINILQLEANKHPELAVEIVSLEVKYPQGAEKMLISAILTNEVPSGTIPLDGGYLVSNVGTVAAIAEYFDSGKPLIERVVTVSGSNIKRPANLLVPIGTSMQELLNACGGFKSSDFGDSARILLGGPMMGMAQKSLDVPVVKGTSGVLALGVLEVPGRNTFQCIRCGRCLEACPMFLNPSTLGLLAKKGLYEEMLEENLMDCMECASCSYVCPSGIPLVQSFRVAKAVNRERKVA
ncbi:MAG: electron transport complex subunit RsxC [SAR324 cluster bacterium]|nr:electron transport complex subunit RsxC [SAR324 cluster bacterium]MBL7034528.1 electron transport complex subunit RsxC [SAR324 cluster bacterium]